MKRIGLSIIVMVIIMIVFLPCGWGEEAKILVQVGERSIKENDLKEYLNMRPLPPPLAMNNEILEERLDDIVTREILYQEAMRQNLDQDPEVRRIIIQALTQKLLEENVEKQVRTRTINDEELQAYYDNHKYQFSRPEQIRLADIFFAVDPQASSDVRAENKQKAESVLNMLLQEKDKGRYKFSKFIREYSEKHAKYPKGDTGFFDAEGNPGGIAKNLAEEGFKLSRYGQIGDHVVETEEGYHIIMLTEKRPAYHKPLEELKKFIERRIRQEELEKMRKNYMKQVKENAAVKRDDKAIADCFEAIKETFKKTMQQGQKDAPPGYGSVGGPPPLPGQVY